MDGWVISLLGVLPSHHIKVHTVTSRVRRENPPPPRKRDPVFPHPILADVIAPGMKMMSGAWNGGIGGICPDL